MKDTDLTAASSSAEIFGESGGLQYYVAGSFVYRSDGTPRGTYPIASRAGTNRECTATIGNDFLFCSAAGLTRTDGSVAGTQVLKTTAPPSQYSRLAKLGGYVYFSGGPYNTQIWRTDGTVGGTWLYRIFPGTPAEIRDLFATSDRIFFTTTTPGPSGLFSADGGADPPVFLGPHWYAPGNAWVLGNRFFFATNASGIMTLWASDGTIAGTTEVRAFPQGAGLWTVFGNRVLFLSSDATHGSEPWVSDGTAEGTRLLYDVEPGPGSSQVRDFGSLDSFALFLDRDKLWRTDGTPAGTTLVRSGLDAHTLVEGRNRALLYGQGVEAERVVHLLWITDGTDHGTVLLRSSESTESPGRHALETGGRLFFSYFTALAGMEIWVTDGTPAGTGNLVDLEPATNGRGPRALSAGATRAYFLQEFLWSTDGTESGTRLITHGGVPIPAADFGSIAVTGDVAYSCALDALWRTDGTDAGTVLLSPAGYGCRWLVRSGSEVFFLLVDLTTEKEYLWRTNGSPEGAAVVREMPTETWGAVAFGGGILFGGLSSASGTEPWISDGTAAGTHVLKDVIPGPGSGLQSEIVAGGSTAYFVGGDSWHELWKTDGTEAGTAPIVEMSSPYYVLAGQIDGTLYFFAYSADSYRWSLWRSDGTAAGTREVRSLGDGALSRDPVNRPVVSGSRVYFAHGEGDTRLFSSDGTHAGTLPLSLPVPRVDFSAVPGGVAFGWESGVGFTDGTPEGTRSLGTASPRLGRDRAESFVRLGSMILFSGWDAGHGCELWRADLEGGGRMFYTVVPCRVVDTRIPEDGPPILDGATREIAVAGRCGVPIDAAGVVLNATVSGSTGDGYIEVGPARRGPTGTRSTSFRAGQTRASSMVLGLDPASQGMVSVRLFAPGYADVILDVFGYFR